MAETVLKDKDRLKEITDSIEQGIRDLFQSDQYTQYLRTMSRFHRYSFNNTILIAMQKPDATLVAGFNKWRDQFERNVIKGEKGIKIIAPTPFKKKIEQEKLDPDTRIPMLGADGKVLTEEKEITIPMYKVVSVFDVSQTEGKPLPTLANDLAGNVQQYSVFLEALRRSSPVPIEFEAMQPSMDGYFSKIDQRIAIRIGMSEVQTVSAAIHEITHATLHNYEQARLAAALTDETAELPKPKDRRTEEVEAESVSYSVCQYYGIQTGENSFGYIAAWSKNKELPELRASLETINRTASGLISDIDRNFREVLKEHDQHETDRGMDTALFNHRTHDLIASYEELFVADVKDRTMTWHGDLGIHVPKDGISKEAQYEVYQAALGVLGETHETFQSSDRYAFRANIMVDMCLRNTLPVPDYIFNQLPQEERSAIADAQTGKTAAAVGQLSDAPEQALDEYPMPDSELTVADLKACGYLDGDMLPLSRDRAIELFEKDFTVYMIENGSADMVLDLDEIPAHNSLYAVSREEWEESRDFSAAIEERLAHQVQRENAFVNAAQDAFAIYQVKDGNELRNIRFEPMSWLESKGITVDRVNYDLVYTAPLSEKGTTEDRLDFLWQRFNNDHPADYHRPSLSVSDIVALNQGGKVSCHYVDVVGFQELPAFLQPGNYRESAGISTENDNRMIGGIINNGKSPTVAELEQQAKAGQPISLSDFAHAVQREHGEKKKSIVQQLRNQPVSREHKKTALHKSAEMEL